MSHSGMPGRSVRVRLLHSAGMWPGGRRDGVQPQSGRTGADPGFLVGRPLQRNIPPIFPKAPFRNWDKFSPQCRPINPAMHQRFDEYIKIWGWSKFRVRCTSHRILFSSIQVSFCNWSILHFSQDNRVFPKIDILEIQISNLIQLWQRCQGKLDCNYV